MSDSSTPPDLDPASGRTDDPLSADRRVLIIGAVSMVLLVLVGVVSASVFTRSACAGIAPDAVPGGVAGDLDTVLADGLGGLFDDERVTLEQYLSGPLAEVFGPLRGAVDVTGADRLAPVGAAGDGLVAAVGDTTTVVATGDVSVRDAAEAGNGTVVGSGATLYSLALTNPGTGQTDAIVPMDASLAGGDCLDTATVGTSFAFYLAADDGQLALFRVEEDGEFPQVELRDVQQGQVWNRPLDAPEIPPGVTGGRLSAGLGDDLVVVGRRAAADDEAPAVSAFARADGEARWQLAYDDLAAAAPSGDTALWADVVDVDDEVVLLALSREDAEGERGDERSLVALDPADGTVRWHEALGGAVPVDATVDAGQVTLLVDTGAGVDARRYAAGDGAPGPTAGRGDLDGAAYDGRGAIVHAGGADVAVAGNGVIRFSDGEVTNTVYELQGTQVLLVDAVTAGDTTVVLVASEDGAVAVVYGG